jgi:hypothetical protein
LLLDSLEYGCRSIRSRCVSLNTIGTVSHLPPPPCGVVSGVVTYYKVEGVNNILKYAAHLSPNLSFKLLSSRITIKKLILGTCQNISDRAAFMDDCVFFHKAGQELLKSAAVRFAEPSRADYPPVLPVLDELLPIVTQHDKCVAKQIAWLKRKLGQHTIPYGASSRWAIQIKIEGQDPTTWLQTLVVRSTVWMAEAKVTDGDDLGRDGVQASTPGDDNKCLWSEGSNTIAPPPPNVAEACKSLGLPSDTVRS